MYEKASTSVRPFQFFTLPIIPAHTKDITGSFNISLFWIINIMTMINTVRKIIAK